MGHRVQRRSVSDFVSTHVMKSPNQSSVVIVSAETPLLAEDDTHGRHTPDRASLMEFYGRTISSGGVIIGGATAAAGMGELLIEVARPLPTRPGDAILTSSPGLALLDHAVVMPYFELIPAGSLEQFHQLFDSDSLTVGIEQNAALVVDADGARCVGLGKVTLLRDNGVVWVGANGESTPAGLLTLNLSSHR